MLGRGGEGGADRDGKVQREERKGDIERYTHTEKHIHLCLALSNAPRKPHRREISFIIPHIQHDPTIFRNLLTFPVFLLDAVVGQSSSDGSRHGFSR